MLRRIKISYKIIGAFLIIGLVPLFIIRTIIFRIAQQTMVDQKVEELGTIADLKVDKINIFFDNLHKDMQTAQDYYNVKTSLPIVSQFLLDQQSDEYKLAKKTLDGQLMTFREAKGFLEFILLDNQGRIAYTTENTHNEEEIGNTFSYHSHEGEIKISQSNEITFSDIFASSFAPSGFEMLAIGPVLDFNNQPAGTIIFAVDMGPVYESIQDNTGLGETGETTLGKSYGDHLLFLSPLRHSPNAALQKRVTYGDKQGIPIQQATQGNSGAGLSVDYRGEQVVAAWRPISNLGWGIIAKIDTDEAFIPIESLRNRSMFIGIIIMAVIVSFAYYLSRTISKPLTNAAKVIDKIGKGLIPSRIDAQGSDEIAKLLTAFNNMADNITKANQKLKSEKASVEGKVKERTKELGEKNVALEESREKVSQGWFLIQKEKARLMASIDNLHVGIVMTDEDDKIIMTNRAVNQMLNFDTSIPVSEQISQAFNLNSLLEDCRQKKKVIGPHEINYKNKIFHLYLTPVMTGITEAEVSGIVILIEDITEQREIERSKEEFFAMATHELRTPLTAIRGNAEGLAEMYKSKVNDTDFDEMIADISIASTRLIDIVNDLLDISKLELGNISFDMKQFSLINVVEEVIRELERTAQQKSIKLHLSKPAKDLPKANADQKRVSQVLINLVGNALKFTDKGQIEIKLESQDTVIKVSVIDTGMGIPKDKQDKLFQKFTQLQEKKVTGTAGTGLGLYISKLMIEGMGGKIYLESSQPDKGSTFVFTLPVAK